MLVYGLGPIAALLGCSVVKLKQHIRFDGAPVGWTKDDTGRRYHTDPDELRAWARSFAKRRSTSAENR